MHIVTDLYGIKSMHFFVEPPPVDVFNVSPSSFSFVNHSSSTCVLRKDPQGKFVVIPHSSFAHFPQYSLSQIYLRKVVEALNGPAGPEVFRQVAGLMEEIVVEWKNYDITLEKRLEVRTMHNCHDKIRTVHACHCVTFDATHVHIFLAEIWHTFRCIHRKLRKLTGCCRRTCAACVLVCTTYCSCRRLLWAIPCSNSRYGMVDSFCSLILSFICEMLIKICTSLCKLYLLSCIAIDSC